MVSRAMPALALMALVLLAASMSACDEAPPTPTSVPRATSAPTATPTIPMPTPKPTATVNDTTDSIEFAFACGPYIGVADWDPYVNSLLWPPDGAEIVFTYIDKIWRVGADGAYLQEVLSANPYRPDPVYSSPDSLFNYGFHVDISPDGSRLAYTSCQFKNDPFDRKVQSFNPRFPGRHMYNYEIATSELDGRGQQRLTDNPWLDSNPIWSPDGDLIAFLTSPSVAWQNHALAPLPDLQLHSMRADGTDVQPVAPRVESAAYVPPAWSPDGQRLAFVGSEDQDDPYGYLGYRVYTVRTDGSDLIKIENSEISMYEYVVTAPTWSPDSERVAFATIDGESGESSVFSATYDGTNLRRIWSSGPNKPGIRVAQVSWSPGGSEIFIVRHPGMYVVRPDGSGLRSLGVEGKTRFKAAWSPDGSRIAVYLQNHKFSGCGRGYIIEECTGGLIASMSRDGTDIRVLVEEVEGDDYRKLRLAQAAATTEPVTGSPVSGPIESTATPPGLGQG